MSSLHKGMQDVIDFHIKNDVIIGESPNIPSRKVQSLRRRLIMEEISELIVALDREDLKEIADGCADVLYVVIGTAISYGIDLDSIWDVVHRNNMLKIKFKDSGGKIIKSKNHEPPPIAEILINQVSFRILYNLKDL